MSCGCNSGGWGENGIYSGVCDTDTPYPSISSESVPSLISNLVNALYGEITKDVSSGKVVWNIPCDPNYAATIWNIPRESGEGLLCYLMRVWGSIPSTSVVLTTGAQTISDKTFVSPIFTGTPVFPAGSITGTMIANGTITPVDLSTGAPSWLSNGNVTAIGSVTATSFIGSFTGNATSATTATTATNALACSGNSATATAAATANTALACTGNSATATTAAACTGNSSTATTATTAATCTGNAASATKLETARTINGVSFDGTANISLPVGTLTEVTATSPLSVVNGTTTPAISLGIVPSNKGGAGSISGILKADGSGLVSQAIANTDYLNTSGNAASATKLNTARKINGVDFDGTADISLPSGSVGIVTADSPISVTNPTTSPNLTLGVIPKTLGGAGDVSGILKANGSGVVSQAIAGTDYVAPSGDITGNAATATTATTATTALACSGNSATASVADSANTCTGNAATATKLQTARTINGVSFDGSSNISIATGSVTNVTGISPILVSNGTSTPEISLGVVPAVSGGAGLTNGILKGDGTGFVSAAIPSVDYVVPTGSITGNAATATIATTATSAITLQNARTINGVSFNGSANIVVSANSRIWCQWDPFRLFANTTAATSTLSVTAGSSVGTWTATGAPFSFGWIGLYLLLPTINGVNGGLLGGVDVATGGIRITSVPLTTSATFQLLNGPATSTQSVTSFVYNSSGIKAHNGISSVTSTNVTTNVNDVRFNFITPFALFNDYVHFFQGWSYSDANIAIQAKNENGITFRLSAYNTLSYINSFMVMGM